MIFLCAFFLDGKKREKSCVSKDISFYIFSVFISDFLEKKNMVR